MNICTQYNLENLHYKLQDYKTAEKELREALEIYRRLAAQYPDAFDSFVAMTLNNLGGLHCNLQDYKTAEKIFYEALKIYRQLNQRNYGLYEPKIQGKTIIDILRNR